MRKSLQIIWNIPARKTFIINPGKQSGNEFTFLHTWSATENNPQFIKIFPGFSGEATLPADNQRPVLLLLADNRHSTRCKGISTNDHGTFQFWDRYDRTG